MAADIRSMHPIVATRRVMVRHRWIRWLVIATLSCGIGLATRAQIAQLDAARQAWADGTSVVVVTRAIAAGEAISAADVQRRRVPPNAVPAGHLSALDGTAIARHRLAAGEMLHEDNVGAGGGAAALLDDTQAAIAIPLTDGSSLPLAVGSAVGLVATADPIIGPIDAATQSMIEGSVIAVEAESVLVAVELADAASVADALASGRVSLVLLRSSSQPLRSPP